MLKIIKNIPVVGSREPENCSANFYVLLLRPNGHFNRGHLHSVSMGRRPYLQANAEKNTAFGENFTTSL